MAVSLLASGTRRALVLAVFSPGGWSYILDDRLVGRPGLLAPGAPDSILSSDLLPEDGATPDNESAAAVAIEDASLVASTFVASGGTPQKQWIWTQKAPDDLWAASSGAYAEWLQLLRYLTGWVGLEEDAAKDIISAIAPGVPVPEEFDDKIWEHLVQSGFIIHGAKWIWTQKAPEWIWRQSDGWWHDANNDNWVAELWRYLNDYVQILPRPKASNAIISAIAKGHPVPEELEQAEGEDPDPHLEKLMASLVESEVIIHVAPAGASSTVATSTGPAVTPAPPDPGLDFDSAARSHNGPSALTRYVWTSFADELFHQEAKLSLLEDHGIQILQDEVEAGADVGFPVTWKLLKDLGPDRGAVSSKVL